MRFKKLIILVVLSLLIMLLGYITGRAEAVTGAEPQTEEPDYWLHPEEWTLPDVLSSEFVTPQPYSTPVPSRSRSVGDLPELEGITELTGISGVNLNFWRQFHSQGDNSVWYFKGHTNVQVAIATSTQYSPYRVWFDSVPRQNGDNFNLTFRSVNGGLVQLSQSNSELDITTGSYNISFSDRFTSPIQSNFALLYQFRPNKLYPHIVSSTYTTALAISDDDLLNMPVYPSLEIIYTDYYGNSVSSFVLRPQVTWAEFCSGYQFYVDLASELGSPALNIDRVNINFNLNPFKLFNTRYADYLIAHPEITGHVPLNIYFTTSSSESNGMGALQFFRGREVTLSERESNFLQSLFVPSQSDIQSLADRYAHDFSNDSTGSFVLSIRNVIFDFLTQNVREAQLTMPAISIPVNGSSYTISSAYTFNFSRLLRDLGIANYIQVATGFFITFAFANSVIAMIVSVFDLKWWDGVR